MRALFLPSTLSSFPLRISEKKKKKDYSDSSRILPYLFRINFLGISLFLRPYGFFNLNLRAVRELIRKYFSLMNPEFRGILVMKNNDVF